MLVNSNVDKLEHIVSGKSILTIGKPLTTTSILSSTKQPLELSDSFIKYCPAPAIDGLNLFNFIELFKAFAIVGFDLSLEFLNSTVDQIPSTKNLSVFLSLA